MVDWDLLIDENALASVLPDEYGRFAGPVRNALAVFLDGLGEARQTAILSEQAALPPTAGISERLALLARSCPVLHKLGQVLARDQRLAPELRQQLQRLESLPPAVPIETIRDMLDEELGPLARRGVELVPPAIAEASVAVVIGFRQPGAEGPEDGVFKILKPGIEEQLGQELELTRRVGAHLDERCDELQIPHVDYEETFEQVREKLQGEVRLDQEQRHLAQARTFYAGEPRVQIPALFEHCTARVTAMQRVTGGKVTDCGPDAGADRRRLSELVVEALLARPIFSQTSPALFHGDPHAGNLFFTDDRRLAILDWSLIGGFGERERVAIVQVMLGAVTLDSDQIVRVLSELAVRPPDWPALVSAVEGWLRRIRQGQFPGINWLVGMLDEAVQSAGLRLEADLMLFRKMLHTLDGVLLDLGAGSSRMDGVLLDAFLRHFAAEWPLRWATVPNSREFATRLSNLDLTRCVLGFPGTAARYWVGRMRDALAAHHPSANASL